jgi:2-iminobutanoate/2-iminopropanoate deaminase
MPNKKAISTKNAPKAIGPYSQEIVVGSFLFISGQLPMDPETGKLIQEGIKERAERTGLHSLLAPCVQPSS